MAEPGRQSEQLDDGTAPEEAAFENDGPEALGVFDDELVIRPRPMRKPDSDIDITPMIDITFLLLIFFLVAATIARQTPVDLPEARYGDAVAMEESAVITIAAADAGGAIVYKGDGVDPARRLSSDDLQAQEDELAAYIQAEFERVPIKHHVMIKAGRGVKHRHVARVSHAAGRVLSGGR